MILTLFNEWMNCQYGLESFYERKDYSKTIFNRFYLVYSIMLLPLLITFLLSFVSTGFFCLNASGRLKFRIKLKILHVFCVSIELLEIYILNIISQANHYLAIYWRSRRLGQYCLDGLKCHNQKLNFNEVIPADLIRGESFRSSLFLPIHIAEHPNNSHQWLFEPIVVNYEVCFIICFGNILIRLSCQWINNNHSDSFSDFDKAKTIFRILEILENGVKLIAKTILIFIK